MNPQWANILMKVLILGALGNLGSRLVNIFAASGFTIAVCVRNKEKLGVIGKELEAYQSDLGIVRALR